MNYRSVADLGATISANAYKVHVDTDLVVGVPRSGMLPATLLALQLNLPLCDLQSLLEDRPIASNSTRRKRSNLSSPRQARHALVVDDSILSGQTMVEVRESLAAAGFERFSTCAVYATKQSNKLVDIAFEEVARPRIFEWNVMHHKTLATACVDIDGVLCADPTPAQNDGGTNYLEFMRSTTPLLRPTLSIARLVTNRLEKYRSHTVEWLEKHGVEYDHLHMLDLPDEETRRRLKPYISYKSDVYMSDRDMQLFIESDPVQADGIAHATGRPVLCWSTQTMSGASRSRTAPALPRAAASKVRRIARRASRHLSEPLAIGSNFRWVAVGQASRIGLQVLGVAILTRLLPASDFGVIAMALAVAAFAYLIRDMGTVATMIQRESLPQSVLSTVFWLNLLVGLLLGVVIYVAAPLIATLFDEPALADVLRLFSVVFPIAATGNVPRGLVERATRFRTLAFLEIGASLAGIVTGVICATQGKGVHALVWQTIVNSTVYTAGLWVTSRWQPTWAWDRGVLREFGSFSSNIVAFNFFNYVIRNSDVMFIGRVLGSAELGFYSIAHRIAVFPMQNLSSAVVRTLMPAFSRMQSDVRQLGDNHVRILGVVAAVVAPLMGGLWVLREPLVTLVLGPDWLPVTPVVAWLALVGLLHSLRAPGGTVLIAMNRTDLLRNLGFFGMFAFAGAYAIGLRWGVVGVAAGYAAANFVFLFPILMLCQRVLSRPPFEFLKFLWRPLLVALIMTGMIDVGDRLLTRQGASDLTRLIVLAATGAALHALALRLLEPKLFARLLRFVLPATGQAKTPST